MTIDPIPETLADLLDEISAARAAFDAAPRLPSATEEDARTDAYMARHGAMVERVAKTPARDMTEIAGKLGLVLAELRDMEESEQPFFAVLESAAADLRAVLGAFLDGVADLPQVRRARA